MRTYRNDFILGCAVAGGLFSAFVIVLIMLAIWVRNQPEFQEWQRANFLQSLPYCQDVNNPLVTCRYTDDEISEAQKALDAIPRR